MITVIVQGLKWVQTLMELASPGKDEKVRGDRGALLARDVDDAWGCNAGVPPAALPAPALLSFAESGAGARLAPFALTA